MLRSMDHPNLADPDFDPSDEQLAELMRRAFAGVGEAHSQALKQLHEQIAQQGAEARRRWLAQRSCNPS